MSATAAFDALASTYDEVFTASPIGRAQRLAVWNEIDRVFDPGMRILEINCGTGEDALHMARRGIRVVACDVSASMLHVATRKTLALPDSSRPRFIQLATEQLAEIRDPQFDGLLSNFSGLNCVADLHACAADLAPLLKPGASALLCVFGRHCAWEIVWYLLRGQPQKAVRRRARAGVEARLDDTSTVIVRYPSVFDMKRSFAPWFRLRTRKGIGIFVPPTFLDRTAQRHPRALNAAAVADRCISRLPLFRDLADHILFRFERTAVAAPVRQAA